MYDSDCEGELISCSLKSNRNVILKTTSFSHEAMEFGTNGLNPDDKKLQVRMVAEKKCSNIKIVLEFQYNEKERRKV